MAFPDTRSNESPGSFWTRYEGPLAEYARQRLRLDPQRALDLARDFCLEQLEREAAGERPWVHATYAARQAARPSATWPPRGFRRFLCVSFYRRCRDALVRERLVPLPPGHDPPEDEVDVFERLAARDLLRSIREEALAAWRGDALEATYFDHKWPADLSAPSPSDAAIARALALPRGQLRTVVHRVQEGIIATVRRRVVAEGWSPEEAARLLTDYFGVLTAPSD